MLDPYILSPVLNSLSFGISELHLRMRQICRPKLYNYPAPVLLTKNWCLFLRFTNQNFGEISVNQVLNNFLLNK
jgi:hypothetical protein